MIPPTSIDGTDITGATIDNQEVQEITVDGDVVFSASVLPSIRGTQVSQWLNNENSGTVAFDQTRGFDADWGSSLWASGAGPDVVHVEQNSNTAQGGVITGGLSDWSHFTGTPEGTIMAWVNRDGSTSDDAIAMYDYHSGGSGGGFFLVISSGTLRWVDNDNGFPNVIGSLSLSANEWYFVALAVDSSSFEFYKSDEPNFTNLDNDSYSTVNQNGAANADPSIGGEQTNGGRAFNGKMSIFAKTDVKLTSTEIAAYRDATKSFFP